MEISISALHRIERSRMFEQKVAIHDPSIVMPIKDSG